MRALDHLVSWPRYNHSQWFGHYRTDVISWCGSLEVGFERATNVTYSMLYNGWVTGNILYAPRDSANLAENV
jgi:hypothetical protein